MAKKRAVCSVLSTIDEAHRRGDQAELDEWREELTDLLYELEE